jgi:hypothetical protein
MEYNLYAKWIHVKIRYNSIFIRDVGLEFSTTDFEAVLILPYRSTLLYRPCMRENKRWVALEGGTP